MISWLLVIAGSGLMTNESDLNLRPWQVLISFHQGIMMMMWRTNVMLVWGSYEQSRRLSRERHKNWARVTWVTNVRVKTRVSTGASGASSKFLISQFIIITDYYHVMRTRIWKWRQHPEYRVQGDKIQFALPDVTGKDSAESDIMTWILHVSYWHVTHGTLTSDPTSRSDRSSEAEVTRSPASYHEWSPLRPGAHASSGETSRKRIILCGVITNGTATTTFAHSSLL